MNMSRWKMKSKWDHLLTCGTPWEDSSFPQRVQSWTIKTRSEFLHALRLLRACIQCLQLPPCKNGQQTRAFPAITLSFFRAATTTTTSEILPWQHNLARTTLLIVAHDRPQYLSRALKSIHQHYPTQGLPLIMISEDGDDAAVAAIVEAFKGNEGHFSSFHRAHSL